MYYLKKNFNLEQKIAELLIVIEDLDKQKRIKTFSPITAVKTDLFKAIDDVAKEKVPRNVPQSFGPRKKRTELLNDLQSCWTNPQK